MPGYELYKLLREAFRGGNTHANRYYVGKTIKDVQGWDRSSSYPDVQLNCKFPIEPFKPFPHVTEADLRELTRKGYAFLCRIYVEHIELIDDAIGCPYIPLSKIRHYKGEVVDNGRILKADYLEMTVTDIDLQIIESQYVFGDIYYGDCWYSHYGYLPGSLREMIKEYYHIKTSLKDVPGQELFYMKTKNKFNSIYGMSAQDPVKTKIFYQESERGFIELDEKGYYKEYLTDDELAYIEDNNLVEDPEVALAKFNKKAVMPYQWGVWTCAWARFRLQKMIEVVDHDQFVYCDTDSIYFVGDADFTQYNKERIADSKSSGGYAADPSGKVHYLGVAEYEKTVPKFRTMGAKKYVYETEDGKLHVTIAGVIKHKAPLELGSIENFKEGFCFREAGGLEAVYNDNITRVYKVEGKDLMITDNVCLRPSTYTLGYAAEYKRLLEGLDVLGVDIL